MPKTAPKKNTAKAVSPFRPKDKRRLLAMGVDHKAISVTLNLELNPAMTVGTWAAKRGKSSFAVSEVIHGTFEEKSKHVPIAKSGHIKFVFKSEGRPAANGLILQFKVGGSNGAVTHWEVSHGRTGRRVQKVEQQGGEDLYVLIPPDKAAGKKGRVEKITIAMPKGAAFVFSGVRVLAYK
jgi:hypothetical protein